MVVPFLYWTTKSEEQFQNVSLPFLMKEKQKYFMPS